MADQPQLPPDAVTDGKRVAMRGPDGWSGTVDVEHAQEAVRMGYRFASHDENRDQFLENKYGNSPITALAEGVARTASFGASDEVLRGLGVSGQALRETRSRNAFPAGVGEVGGAFLPGAGAVAGLAGKAAGGLVKEAIGGTSVLGRIAGGVTEAGTAGAVFGAGQAVSNVALADHPMTPEAIAEELGSSVLGGAGYGAAGGLFLSAIGEAARGVKLGTERMTARAAVDAEKAVTGVEAAKPLLDDAERARIGSLDKEAVKAEVETEKASLTEARLGEGKVLADDVRAFREDARLTGVQVTEQLPKGLGYAREVIKAERGVEGVVGNMKGLAANPGKALDPLQRYEQAMTQVVPRLDPELGAQVQKNIERVQKLQERVQAAAAPLESPRLTALGDRLDAIKEGGPGIANAIETKTKATVRAAAATALHHVMGVIPGGAFVAHMLGDVLGEKASELVKGLAGKVEGTAAGHMEKITKGADAAIRATQGAAAQSGFVASKVLSAVRFAENAPTKYKQGAADVFKARAGELAQAMAEPQKTQAAIAQRVMGLGTVSPSLAQKVAGVMMQKLQYAFDVMPKRLPVGTASDGYDRWEPPASAIHAWAKVVDVVLHPTKIMDDLKAGRLTQQAVDAVRATSPETFSAIQQALWSRVAEIRKELPYTRQIGLSLMFDRPFTTTMEPAFIAASQSHFIPQGNGPQPSQGSPPRSSASLSKLPVTTPTVTQKLSS